MHFSVPGCPVDYTEAYSRILVLEVDDLARCVSRFRDHGHVNHSMCINEAGKYMLLDKIGLKGLNSMLYVRSQ